MRGIAWLPWSADAFARARSDGKPVLLSIAASWCGHCRLMDASSYASPDVIALAADRFVPVRVDADRRPDISLRYGLGGWPTTAFLTPEGEMLGGGTFVEAARLGTVLREVADAFAGARHGGRPRIASQPEEYHSESPTVARLMDQVFATFDPVHGGFGTAPRFPHTGPVRLALRLFRDRGSEEAREIAIRSLDAMGWGPLYDEKHGGFFRCAGDPDWGAPSREKLLDVNAALLSLYLEAFETLQLARYGERAENLLLYVQTWLADPVDGGWAASQRADADYYALASSEAVDPSAAPLVDRTLFTDWNAVMVSAALQAGFVMRDPSVSEFAIKSLERVLLLSYKPGAGVAHYHDGTIHPRKADTPIRGLLDDHVAMAMANLDAFEATANVVYKMMAEELAIHATRTMWDEAGGGFFDHAPDAAGEVGLLRDRFKPFTGNCAAAGMLHRLAGVTEKEMFREFAERTLTAISGRAAAQGPLAAEYVLAAGLAAEQ
jgi:uncharacterized protein YyaL (SSP411 family)